MNAQTPASGQTPDMLSAETEHPDIQAQNPQQHTVPILYITGHRYIATATHMDMSIDEEQMTFHLGQAVVVKYKNIRLVRSVDMMHALADHRFKRMFDSPDALGYPGTLPPGYHYVIIDALVERDISTILIAVQNAQEICDMLTKQISPASRTMAIHSKRHVIIRVQKSFWPVVTVWVLLGMICYFVPVEAGIAKLLLMGGCLAAFLVFLFRYGNFRAFAVGGILAWLVLFGIFTGPDYYQYAFPQQAYARQVAIMDSMITITNVHFEPVENYRHKFHFTLHNISDESILFVSVGIRAYNARGELMSMPNGEDTYIGFHPQELKPGASVDIAPTLFEYAHAAAYEYALLGVYTFHGEYDTYGNAVYAVKYAAPPPGAAWIRYQGDIQTHAMRTLNHKN